MQGDPALAAAAVAGSSSGINSCLSFIIIKHYHRITSQLF